MKTQILLFLLISILAFGCRSTKKLAESSSVASNQTETTQNKEAESSNKSDFNQKDNVNNDILIEEDNVTVTNKYYPPTKADSLKAKAENKLPIGALESTTTSTTTKRKADKTKAESSKIKKDEANSKTKEDNSAKSSNDSSIQTKNTEKKSVPIQWGWIFACSALVIAVFIYFSKSKLALIVKTFIKSIFGK